MVVGEDHFTGILECCHLLVELVAGVDDNVPEELVVEHSGVRCLEQHGDGACVALDLATRLCTIYERRPQTCRQFERGSGLCRTVLGTPRARATAAAARGEASGSPRPRLASSGD